MGKRKPVKKPRAARFHYTQIREPGRGFLLQLYTHAGQFQPAPESMPNEIKVYGQTYKIFYHTRIYSDKKKAQRLRGLVIFPNRLIFLDPMQSIHDLRETLYHEVGHVYMKVWQTKTESLSKLTYQQIEDVCDLIGEAIPDLVSNNKLSA